MFLHQKVRTSTYEEPLSPLVRTGTPPPFPVTAYVFYGPPLMLVFVD